MHNYSSVVQIGTRVTGRLYSPEVEAIWESTTGDASIHQIRKHGLELPFIGGALPVRSHCAGNATKCAWYA